MEKSAGSGSFDAAKVAMLARLELSKDQLEKFQSEMEKIVGYVDQLSELNVDGIEPTAHASARTNVLRDDAAETHYTRETMLANAPATIDGELVKVPRVLPGEGIA